METTMIKVMGIDISSRSTGWSILQSEKLIEFGKINPTGKMTVSQKLFLFHIELKKLIERYQPDEIAIEDVPLVKSASVAKLLARFNGVAMIEAYRHMQKEPILYMPTEWKSQVEGCTGGSKKCEVQLAICKKFKLLDESKIKFYQERINEAKVESGGDTDDIKSQLKLIKKQIKKAQKINDSTLVELQSKEKSLIEIVAKNRKSKKKDLSVAFDQISMDIYTETSINEDIADSIGVAIAHQKELAK
jgi:crossover junction endodeoxyribonuclease RuvC